MRMGRAGVIARTVVEVLYVNTEDTCAVARTAAGPTSVSMARRGVGVMYALVVNTESVRRDVPCASARGLPVQPRARPPLKAVSSSSGGGGRMSRKSSSGAHSRFCRWERRS